MRRCGASWSGLHGAVGVFAHKAGGRRIWRRLWPASSSVGGGTFPDRKTAG
ncbi:hypothetical protein C4K39_2313 [Pseudomonas sessilinigenes]|nr:hypothetical protein C4K39_2313 [Pseudomonas sessilinigenes]